MFIPQNMSQCNLKFTGAGLPHGAQVTFAVANTNDKSPLAVAQVVKDAWGTCGIMNMLVNSVTFSSILVKNGPNDLGPAAELAVTFPGAGISEGITPNVAVLVRKNTAVGGHTGSGRMFIPGWGEANVDAAGKIASAALGSMQTACNALHDQLVTQQHPMFLLHTREDHPIGPLGVTSLSVQSLVATQRRRLRG